jgi:hypothetical protein
MRQPRWNIDEVLLAVNTYFEIGDTRNIIPDNPLVIELSQTLRALPIHKNKDNIFRNTAGVEMILKNIATLDTNSHSSMRSFTNLQKNVYLHYINEKNKLRGIVIALKSCVPLLFEYYNPIERSTQVFMAGNILYLYHLYLENMTKISKLVKDNYAKREKGRCLCCEIELSNCYGELGYKLLELHYAEPITNYHNGMKVLAGKFVPLCPACHKLAHSDPDLLEISNLKNTIKVGGKLDVSI